MIIIATNYIMKKFITPLVFLFSATLFAQETPQEEIYKRDIAKNELSLGALNLVAFGALDVAYERITSPNTSWALEAFILALNRDNENISEVYSRDFSLTGKYKYFFGDNSAHGFYVNGLAMVSNGDYEVEFYDSDGYYTSSESKSYTDFALGFGIGVKLVAKQGFFLDVSSGIGRNLLSENSPTIVGQLNVNLGMRF